MSDWKDAYLHSDSISHLIVIWKVEGGEEAQYTIAISQLNKSLGLFFITLYLQTALYIL